MRGIVVVAALLLPAWAHAQMYKCVDERGVTTYSDKPRPGCKGGAVDIRPSPPLSGQVQPRSEDLAGEDAAFRRRQLERERAGAKEQAALDKRCKSLRQEHARLSSGRRLSQVNADGERVYLPDDVRSQRLEQVSAALRACP
jgi:hypothetical protein